MASIAMCTERFSFLNPSAMVAITTLPRCSNDTGVYTKLDSNAEAQTEYMTRQASTTSTRSSIAPML